MEEELITGSISRLSNEISRNNNRFSQTATLALTAAEPTPPTISNLNRQVFDKNAFLSTVDTSFSELGIEEVDPSFFDVNLATINDFFTLYGKFFFEIPKFGVSDSHEYLIIESSNYINFNQNQEEIQALLTEISELRNENLELIESNANLQIELAQSLNRPSTGSFAATGTGTGIIPGTGTPPPEKIICNELYIQGYLPEKVWDADERYGEMMFEKDPKLVIGYQMWAKYVVKYMKNNPQNTKYLYRVFKPWTEYMGYKMGIFYKPPFTGKLINWLGVQFSHMVFNIFGGKKILNYIKSRSNKI